MVLGVHWGLIHVHNCEIQSDLAPQTSASIQFKLARMPNKYNCTVQDCQDALDTVMLSSMDCIPPAGVVIVVYLRRDTTDLLPHRRLP